jgi:hypothetical protein
MDRLIKTFRARLGDFKCQSLRLLAGAPQGIDRHRNPITSARVGNLRRNQAFGLQSFTLESLDALLSRGLAESVYFASRISGIAWQVVQAHIELWCSSWYRCCININPADCFKSRKQTLLIIFAANPLFW